MLVVMWISRKGRESASCLTLFASFDIVTAWHSGHIMLSDSSVSVCLLQIRKSLETSAGICQFGHIETGALRARFSHDLIPYNSIPSRYFTAGDV